MGTFGGESLVTAVASMLGVNVLTVAKKIQRLSDVHEKSNAIVLVDVERYRMRNEVPMDTNISLVQLSNFIKEERFCVVLRYDERHFDHCGTLGTMVQICEFEPWGGAITVGDLGLSSACVCSQRRPRSVWMQCLRQRRLL